MGYFMPYFVPADLGSSRLVFILSTEFWEHTETKIGSTWCRTPIFGFRTFCPTL